MSQRVKNKREAWFSQYTCTHACRQEQHTWKVQNKHTEADFSSCGGGFEQTEVTTTTTTTAVSRGLSTWRSVPADRQGLDVQRGQHCPGWITRFSCWKHKNSRPCVGEIDTSLFVSVFDLTKEGRLENDTQPV